VDEIGEFRRRGVEVVVCSVLRPGATIAAPGNGFQEDVLYLEPSFPWHFTKAIWLLARQSWGLRDLWLRTLSGDEPASRRLKTLLHTWLGAYLAIRLRERNVEHIHVHHGYFASLVAMVAARLLGIGFSMTLHGSDLLLHEAYLDLKLSQCLFCVTISDFNRNYLLCRYPQIAAAKILVQRMGVDCTTATAEPLTPRQPHSRLSLLAVGRLHPVKDHDFLVHACRLLKDRGGDFCCAIAGDGPERQRLQRLTYELHLEKEVHLLGHVQHEHLEALYRQADLVVLTSQSEGIPLTLMEAMSFAKPVLAPAITGIPELVADGKNGFLYRAASMSDFVERVEMIRDAYSALGPLCQAARQQVSDNFDRQKNLAAFCDAFLSRLGQSREKQSCENTLLQQI
jgi:glycosyltransferase involved in cell wall biosynthesis